MYKSRLKELLKNRPKSYGEFVAEKKIRNENNYHNALANIMVESTLKNSEGAMLNSLAQEGLNGSGYAEHIKAEADRGLEAKRQSAVTAESSVPVARIKKAIRYMNENYASRLGLEDIAAASNLSKSEFCRCFKRITRQTAFEYLMDLRIRKSLQLLEGEGLSVTETALNSGFSSSSYYTEIFRRYMGCTPREYMRRQKG